MLPQHQGVRYARPCYIYLAYGSRAITYGKNDNKRTGVFWLELEKDDDKPVWYVSPSFLPVDDRKPSLDGPDAEEQELEILTNFIFFWAVTQPENVDLGPGHGMLSVSWRQNVSMEERKVWLDNLTAIVKKRKSGPSKQNSKGMQLLRDFSLLFGSTIPTAIITMAVSDSRTQATRRQTAKTYVQMNLLTCKADGRYKRWQLGCSYHDDS